MRPGRDERLALNPSQIEEGAKTVGWNHMRASVVVPIGVIVVVAIVCVVVAVLSSARRADEVALDHERQLFTRSLTNHGERVLREIASVATSEAAVRKIRDVFEPDWVQIYVGLRLQSFFDHDFVFVTDANDRFLYASLGHRSVDPNWLLTGRGAKPLPPLQPVETEPAAIPKPGRAKKRQHRLHRL